MNQMKKYLIPMLLFSQTASAALLEDVKVGGFIDTYYAYDFNQPKDRERQFTTQPVRHNEFNINLAYLDATLKRDKTRGRIALQYGNAVTKNYSGEPTQGATSGPQDMKAVQEGYVGKRIGEKTWIDLGIFLGNIGAESWISKDNFTYTRSLNLDYVPYYSSGVRLEHQLSEKESIQLQLLNGWQNISENNRGKAVGMQYKRVVSEKATFVYNNFFGDEEVTSSSPRFRAYHNFFLNYSASDQWQFITAFDLGHQSQKDNDGVDPWYAVTITARRMLNTSDSISLRAEYYNDRHQANVLTGTANGFQVSSASVNYDQKFDENAVWRTELRGFYSLDKIFPAEVSDVNRLNGFLVTSLALWF